MDNVSALNVFVRVADSGNFASAARELGISASAVGKSMTRLEERVRTRLFHRSTRCLTLTPEGAAFLERCRRILAEISAAESELAGAVAAPRGLLRISLPAIGDPFLSVLSHFQDAYPEIDLELDFTNRNVDLIREGFDAALRSSALEDSSLTARDVGGYRMVLVGSPGYLAKRGVPNTPEDLAGHDRLGFRLPGTGKLIPLAFKDPACDPADGLGRLRLVANNSMALIHFARQGHGLAYISDFLVREEILEGSLRSVLDDHLAGGGRFHLVWASGRNVAPKLRAFIDYMVAHLLKPGAALPPSI